MWQWGACSRFWLAAAAEGKRALRAVLQVCSAAHWPAPQLSSKRQMQICFASWTSSIGRLEEACQTKVRHGKGQFFLVDVLRSLLGREGVSRPGGRCSCVVSWCGPRKQKRKFWHFSTGHENTLGFDCSNLQHFLSSQKIYPFVEDLWCQISNAQ